MPCSVQSGLGCCEELTSVGVRWLELRCIGPIVKEWASFQDLRSLRDVVFSFLLKKIVRR